METTKKSKSEFATGESEVLSYNMGGYIYKVAYKQLDKLDDYADKNNLTNWFRTAKSLWRKVKASLIMKDKDHELVSKTDELIESILEEMKTLSGGARSRSEQEERNSKKYNLIKDMEEFEQNVYKGMVEIKMWIPTTKEFNSIEEEFKQTF